jgi:hypothetical protein
MVGVIAPAMTQVNPSDEGHIIGGAAAITQHDELLVVRAELRDAHVQEDLASCVLDLIPQAAVLRGAILEGEMGAPEKAPHVSSSGCSGGEDVPNFAPVFVEVFVGVASPIREEQEVAVIEFADGLQQLREIGASVDERTHKVSASPAVSVIVSRVQRRVRVAARLGRQEPVVRPVCGYHRQLSSPFRSSLLQDGLPRR